MFEYRDARQTVTAAWQIEINRTSPEEHSPHCWRDGNIRSLVDGKTHPSVVRRLLGIATQNPAGCAGTSRCRSRS